MIETWKYLHGQHHDNNMPIQRGTDTTTRGQSMKSSDEGEVSQAPAKKLLRHRVVTENNVTSPYVNVFKNRSDAFWHVHKFEQSDDFPRTRTNTSQD